MPVTPSLSEAQPTLFADGFEEALLGIGIHFSKHVAIYSYSRCISILMDRDGMTEEEADEYMDFNVLGAYVGEYTPIFLMDGYYESN
jgi:hypothetical protein